MQPNQSIKPSIVLADSVSTIQRDSRRSESVFGTLARDAFDAVRALRARSGDDVLRGGWYVISIENILSNVYARRGAIGTRRGCVERTRVG